MKNITLLLFLFITVTLIIGCGPSGEEVETEEMETEEIEVEEPAVYLNEGNQHILLFTKTDGFRHSSIDPGIEALIKMGNEKGFSITHTESPELFNENSLAEFDAVVFLNTTMTLFEGQQRDAFQNYIQSGGGFVGIHSATDTEYDWEWYGNLVGAYFSNHPGNPNVRNAIVRLVDPGHPATAHLPEEWEREDEWYNFGFINPDIQVLLALDTDSYEGSDHPGDHPISWYHHYDGGRSFYTGLGHTHESFSEGLFLDHLYGGLQFAMGEDQ